MRLGYDLCQGEQEFLHKRKRVVAGALKRVLHLERDLQGHEVCALECNHGMCVYRIRIGTAPLKISSNICMLLPNPLIWKAAQQRISVWHTPYSWKISAQLFIPPVFSMGQITKDVIIPLFKHSFQQCGAASEQDMRHCVRYSLVRQPKPIENQECWKFTSHKYLLNQCNVTF